MVRRLTRLAFLSFDNTGDPGREAHVAVQLERLVLVEGIPPHREPERLLLMPSTDLDGTFDLLGKKLEAVGFERLPPGDVAVIVAAAEARWRPDVRAEFAALEETQRQQNLALLSDSVPPE